MYAPGQDAAHIISFGLFALQHRGQESAGIAASDGQTITVFKDKGLVSQVFDETSLAALPGHLGIGHTRYSTSGSTIWENAQPAYRQVEHTGIALGHNGNLTNSESLQADLFREDMRHVNTTSDSEVLLNVFAHELQVQGAHDTLPEHVFNAVHGVHRRCRGAYAAVAMIIGVGIVGFRDPLGIRPLVFGRRQIAGGFEYMIASESVALDISGFDKVRDVAPGEAVFISNDGDLHTQVCAENTRLMPCIFEYVYLARPDSILDEVSVYKARLRMGEHLAVKIMERYPGGKHDIDVVVPIPDTGRTAALPLSHALNVKYREGFIKNRYIGRTFIMPGQSQRTRSVRQKFNVIELEFKDKNVLLVDDSIVRGTTIQQIIQMAREAGAKNVYLASAAPPVRHPNVYGIDMPTPEEFVANDRTTDEISEVIGADWLVYQDLDDLIDSAREGNPDIDGFECSVYEEALQKEFILFITDKQPVTLYKT